MPTTTRFPTPSLVVNNQPYITSVKRQQGVFGIEEEAGEYSPGLRGSTVQLNVGSVQYRA
jgi:hypothetical protein